MLRRPADFFAGASDWHSAMLITANASFVPEAVRCEERRPQETVKAEVVRNVRWLLDVAAPSVAAAWDFLGSDFLEVVTNKKLPGRLNKFAPKELQAAFSSAFGQYFTAGGDSLTPALAS
jgi:phage replication initiation protein